MCVTRGITYYKIDTAAGVNVSKVTVSIMICSYPVQYEDGKDNTVSCPLTVTDNIIRDFLEIELAIRESDGEVRTRESYCIRVLQNKIEKLSSLIEHLRAMDIDVADELYRRSAAFPCLLLQIRNLLSGDQARFRRHWEL